MFNCKTKRQVGGWVCDKIACFKFNSENISWYATIFLYNCGKLKG